jgi:hypothetical protein
MAAATFGIHRVRRPESPPADYDFGKDLLGAGPFAVFQIVGGPRPD